MMNAMKKMKKLPKLFKREENTEMKKEKRIELFKTICQLSQSELKTYLQVYLHKHDYVAVSGDGFLYAKGDIPIMLTAHLDTVHKETPVTIITSVRDNKTYISSPQGIGGDDRCGVYMIMRLINKGYKPYILFCEDEEIGGVGSDKFIETHLIDEVKTLDYIIELDRANKNDMVFYDCDNSLFTNYIDDVIEYTETYGSFSDISNLCPATKIAGVNLSCGYYKAHTKDEYVIFEEMEDTQNAVEKLLKQPSRKFEYIERERTPYSWNSYGWMDDDYYSYNDNYSYYKYGGSKTKSKKTTVGAKLVVVWFDSIDSCEQKETFTNHNIQACWLDFFFNHPATCLDDVIDFQEF